MIKTDIVCQLIQANLVWEKPEKNREYFEHQILVSSENPDLIILPEMFTTGFSMKPDGLEEEMNGATQSWMLRMAEKKDALILGSIIVKEKEKVFNRLLAVGPEGLIAVYDKRHLFRMAGEDEKYTAGKDKVIIKWRGWTILPLICYDLRFPVFSRNVDLSYDVLIYVANWPQKRIRAWQTLLKARAIENQAYVIGVNRIGEDENGFRFSGDSLAIDYLGEPLLEAHNKEGSHFVTFAKDELSKFRNSFPAWNDADSFSIY